VLVSAVMNQIDFRTDHRLNDTIALQFFVLRHHLLRRGLILAVFMLGGLVVAHPDERGALVGFAGGSGAKCRPLCGDLSGRACCHPCHRADHGDPAWRRLSKPRQIRATITADSITLQKDGFSYGARWSDANLLTENPNAFLMKFNQLYMRLPKRGFAPGEAAQFRALASTAVPTAANRLR